MKYYRVMELFPVFQFFGKGNNWHKTITAVSPRSERSVKRPTIEGKRVNERGWVAGSTCLQWKQVYATLPYPTTSIPPPPPPPQHTHTQPIDLFHPFSLSNGFTEVQSTVFQLYTLIFSRAVHCGVT